MSIKGVIYETSGDMHEDERRAILSVFNSDLGDFKTFQVKVIKLKKDAILGNHYHKDYRELYYILEGESKFILEDVNTKEKQTFNLKKGHRILIPKKVAHKLFVKSNTIFIGCTGLCAETNWRQPVC